MLIEIIQQTPTWVMFLLLALVAIGISRSRPRSVPARRIFILPLAFTALSLFSIYSAFVTHAGGSLNELNAILVTSYLAWLCAAAVFVAIAINRGARRDVTYSVQTQLFQLPGSWLPLCWMISIFLIKYILAVLMAVQPSLHGSSVFAIVIGLLSGSLNGILMGSAWRIWRVMQSAGGNLGAVGPSDLYAGK